MLFALNGFKTTLIELFQSKIDQFITFCLLFCRNSDQVSVLFAKQGTIGNTLYLIINLPKGTYIRENGSLACRRSRTEVVGFCEKVIMK